MTAYNAKHPYEPDWQIPLGVWANAEWWDMNVAWEYTFHTLPCFDSFLNLGGNEICMCIIHTPHRIHSSPVCITVLLFALLNYFCTISNKICRYYSNSHYEHYYTWGPACIYSINLNLLHSIHASLFVSLLICIAALVLGDVPELRRAVV